MKIKNVSKFLLILFIGAFILSCSKKEKSTEVAGINLANLDTTVSPKQNFYKFVNGNWLKNNEIPDNRTSVSAGLEVYLRTKDQVAGILKDAAKNPKYTKGTDQRKAIDLYESYLDTTARNKAGFTPLKPFYDKIDKISNVADLQNYLVSVESKMSSPFFGLMVEADLKNSKMNTLYIGVGALGLPDRDYYTNTDKDSKLIRQQYVEHITKMFGLVNEKKAAKQASDILELETLLAKPMLTKVERRDARKQYNPMSINDLSKLTSAIKWTNYLNALGIKDRDSIIVTQPKYFKSINAILKKSNVNSWKSYLKWIALKTSAYKLSTTLEKTNWEFYSKTLRGSKKQLPIDERGLGTVNRSIGEILGKLYVDKYFPPEAKANAVQTIQNVINAYKVRINNLTWMADVTKKKAIEKLDKFTVKIGYPDVWRDYSKLKLISVNEGGSFFDNMQRITTWNFNKDIAKIGKPVDKTEWGMSPQTVNAYFNPLNNEIVFPAAILQTPFYNYKADAAVNYGGIGAVIGHEISHAFDDSGARFDADGNLNNWWQKEDLEHFKELGKNLVAQFDALEPFPGVHVNGAFTLGENIGDLGGTNAAYDALEKYLKDNGSPGKIDGFSPEQRFFMSWATVWRNKSRDKAVKTQIKTDPHAPGFYRGYVPLTNQEAFFKAFNIVEGDSMFVKPEDRVVIW